MASAHVLDDSHHVYSTNCVYMKITKLEQSYNQFTGHPQWVVTTDEYDTDARYFLKAYVDIEDYNRNWDIGEELDGKYQITKTRSKRGFPRLDIRQKGARPYDPNYKNRVEYTLRKTV